MKKEVVGLGAWLCISLLLCFIMHSYFEPLFARYQFVDDAGFKQKQFAGSLEYKDFVESYYAGAESEEKTYVNPIFARNLPADLDQLQPKDKTDIFISLIAPEALRVNDRIREERDELLFFARKMKTFHSLTAKEKWRLNYLYKKYKVTNRNFEELLIRVDLIPPSLIIAQAITESGWGTSRFAQEGNGLYGQHVSGKSKAKYILSLHGNVKVAAFDSIFEATLSYAENLNSHRAYSVLREVRAEFRENAKMLDGADMARGLLHYSEIGERYIKDIQYIIERYNLKDFDTAQLNHKVRGVSVLFER